MAPQASMHQQHHLPLLNLKQCRRHRLESGRQTAWAAGAPLLHPRTTPGQMLAAEAEGLAAETSSAQAVVPETALAEAGPLSAAMAGMHSHGHHLEEAVGAAAAVIQNFGQPAACQAKDCTLAGRNFDRLELVPPAA